MRVVDAGNGTGEPRCPALRAPLDQRDGGVGHPEQRQPRSVRQAPAGVEPGGNHESTDIRWVTPAELRALDVDTGTLTNLLTEVDGVPLVFTDDLEIARDGMIYFSDASIKYDQKHYMYDMLEARPWGRLIRYNPATGEATTLLRDLYFANGIALSQNNDFVLINETFRYRIIRYWISGPNAGQHEALPDDHVPVLQHVDAKLVHLRKALVLDVDRPGELASLHGKHQDWAG